MKKIPVRSGHLFNPFKGGTRGAPIMPRDAVSRTANVERNGGHIWVKAPWFDWNAPADHFEKSERVYWGAAHRYPDQVFTGYNRRHFRHQKMAKEPVHRNGINSSFLVLSNERIACYEVVCFHMHIGTIFFLSHIKYCINNLYN